MSMSDAEFNAYKSMASGEQQAKPAAVPLSDAEFEAYKTAASMPHEEVSKPGFIDGLIAGFQQKTIKTAEGLDMADVGHFIGGEGLPMIGAAIGATAGPIGIGVGAAAGRAVQKGLARAGEALSGGSEAVKQEGAASVLRDVGSTGVVSGLTPVAMSKIVGPIWAITSRIPSGFRKVLVDNADEMAGMIGRTTAVEVREAAIDLAEDLAKVAGVSKSVAKATAKALKKGADPVTEMDLAVRSLKKSNAAAGEEGRALIIDQSEELVKKMNNFVMKKVALEVQDVVPEDMASYGLPAAAGLLFGSLKTGGIGLLSQSRGLAARAITGASTPAGKAGLGAVEGAIGGLTGDTSVKELDKDELNKRLQE